jgi:hypothetical protein
MKILVISDSHKNTKDIEVILARHAHEIYLACHLGDHAHDLLQLQSKFPTYDMVAVAGNCDYNGERERVLAFSPCAENEEISARILLVHGHNHGVRMNLDRLAYYAKEKNLHAVFYGHTHIPFAGEYGGVFFMNPGSLALPRGGSKASYGIAEILPQGKIIGKVLPI